MFEALQTRLNHRFKDVALLNEALTHPSFLHEHPESGTSNQRLEFLGDAVLQLVLTEELFRRFPLEREGVLTKRRSAFTSGEFLVRLARHIQLEQALRLGTSEEHTGGRGRASSLEDALEAVIGAIYLDAGLEVARTVVLSLIGPLDARIHETETEGNPKGRLQEFAQARHGNQALRYEALHVSGEDHAREYEATVYLLDQCLGKGRGHSKKSAEEAAARSALAALQQAP